MNIAVAAEITVTTVTSLSNDLNYTLNGPEG
jgi:hypothetical protein